MTRWKVVKKPAMQKLFTAQRTQLLWFPFQVAVMLLVLWITNAFFRIREESKHWAGGAVILWHAISVSNEQDKHETKMKWITRTEDTFLTTIKGIFLIPNYVNFFIWIASRSYWTIHMKFLARFWMVLIRDKKLEYIPLTIIILWSLIFFLR